MAYYDEIDGYLADRDSLILAISVLETLTGKAATLIDQSQELLNARYLDDMSRGHIADFIDGLADLRNESLEAPLAALARALDLHEGQNHNNGDDSRRDDERNLGVKTVATDKAFSGCR